MVAEAGIFDIASGINDHVTLVEPGSNDVVYSYTPKSSAALIWYRFTTRLPFYEFDEPVHLAFDVLDQVGSARIGEVSRVRLLGREPTVPHVTIASFEEGQSVDASRPLTMTGTGVDSIDGILDGTALRWYIDGASVGFGPIVEIDGFSEGAHVVELRAVNSAGNETSRVVHLTAVIPAPLTLLVRAVRIVEPTDLTSIEYGEPLTLAASLPPEATPALVQLQWVLEGETERILDGNSGSLEEVLPGSYQLVLKVRPYPFVTETIRETRELEVRAPEPRPEILEPVMDFRVARGARIRLSGHAWDLMEDEYPADRLLWRFDGNEVLGAGSTLSMTVDLEPGMHRVQLEASSVFETVTTAELSFFVLDPPPTVTILEPPDDSQAYVELPLFLEATSPDNVTTWTWHSSEGELIPSGQVVEATNLATGPHLISVRAAGTGGDGNAAVSVDVVPSPLPVVQIHAPVEGPTYRSNSNLLLIGSGFDVTAGVDLPEESLFWLAESGSTGQFPLGQGSSLGVLLEPAAYTITLAGTDSLGKGNSDSRTILVIPPPPPVLSSWSVIPETLPVFVVDPIQFSAGGAWDPDTPELGLDDSAYVWTSSLQGQLFSGQSRQMVLMPGLHTLSLIVTGLQGTTFTTWTTLEVHTLPPPLIQISQPAHGATTYAEDDIAFGATGSDFRANALVETSYAWWSSQEGTFRRGMSSFVGELSLGSHQVVVTARDAYDQTTSTAVEIEVLPPLTPQVAILTPTTTGPVYQGWPTRLLASSFNPVTGDSLPKGGLSWRSDVEGELGIGDDFYVELDTLGLHVLELVGTTAGGRSGRAIVAVQVVHPQPPSIYIVPGNLAAAWATEPLTLTGISTDPQDGELLGASFQWRQDGPNGPVLANGPLLELPGFVDGAWNEFWVKATNSFGLSRSRSIRIFGVTPTPPVLIVESPTPDMAAWFVDPLPLSATALDFLDHPIPSENIAWDSLLRGNLATGSTTTVMRPEGPDWIRATATDHLGRNSKVIRHVEMNRPPHPTLEVTLPSDSFNSLWSPDSITMTASAVDFRSNPIPEESIVWKTHRLSQPLGTGSTIVTTTLPLGYNVMSVHATDVYGLRSSRGFDVEHKIPTPPLVALVSPSSGFETKEGAPVSLEAWAWFYDKSYAADSDVVWSSTVPSPSLPAIGLTTVVTLMAGTQQISLSVTDDRGQNTTKSRTVEVMAPTPPTLTISSPAEGSATWVVSVHRFAVDAVDYLDDAIPGGDILWSSSLDGDLGAGASLYSVLTTGTHLIVVSAEDFGGRITTATHTVRVEEPPSPNVMVSWPPDPYTTWIAAPLDLIGYASDYRSEPLTGGALLWSTENPEPSIIATGAETTTVLPGGTHAIHLTATDGRGNSTTRTVNVQAIQKPAPAVTILTPPPPTQLWTLTSVSLSGTAADSETGQPLPADEFTWLSSIDGQLAQTSATDTMLSTGHHVLTLEARDSIGTVGVATTSVTVLEPPSPIVSITSPPAGYTTWTADTVTLAAFTQQFDAAPVEDTSIVWSSSLDGTLGSGSSTATADLSTGAHVLSLDVTDSRGKLVTQTVSITILEPPVPLVSISSPEDTFTTWAIDPFELAGSASDYRSRVLTGSSVTWYDGQIPLGDGSLSSTVLATGSHEVRLVAIDDRGHGNEASISVHARAVDPPSVSISAPQAGYTTWELNAVALTGLATDFRGTAVTGGSLIWTLEPATALGTGGSLVTTFSAGAHTVRLDALDGLGNVASVITTLHVQLTPPPELLSMQPNDGFTTFEADPVDLSVSLRDFLGQTLEGNSVRWELEDGSELLTGAGGTVSFAYGSHVLTMRATDHRGKSTEIARAIEILQRTPPVVSMSEPAAGFTTWIDDPILFAASATDFRGTPIDGANFEWRSSQLPAPFAMAASVETTLPLGSQTISLTVTDTTGLTSVVALPVTVADTPLPEVTISVPAQGLATWDVDWVDLSGGATDYRNQALNGNSLTWSSSISSPSLPASGSSTSVLLATGPQTLTLSAIDDRGKTGAIDVDIVVQTVIPPAITISSPQDGTTTWVLSQHQFVASASDYHGTAIGNGAFVWTSDIDGSLGTGSMVTSSLSTAVHSITLSAEDSGGRTTSESISISVVEPPPPVVIISHPPTSYATWEGAPVLLTAEVSDFSGQAVTGAALIWETDHPTPAVLGTGSTVSTTLSSGVHAITLVATDIRDNESQSSVRVVVNVKPPPVVTIETPPPPESVFTLVSLQLTGTATDSETGLPLLTEALQWTSSLQGAIATGPVTATILTTGHHLIYLTATDTLGAEGVATSSIEVLEPGPPAVILSSPTEGYSTWTLDPVLLSASVVQFDETTIPENQLLWRSSLDGIVAIGSSSTVTTLSIGLHALTFTATDSRDKITSTTVGVNVSSTPVPAVTLISPPSGLTTWTQDLVAFEVAATDYRDRVLTGPEVVWSEGETQIGTGSFLATALGTGTHEINVKVTDDRGKTMTQAVEVAWIESPVPIVSLDVPAQDLTTWAVDTLMLAGTATDYRGLAIPPGSVTWYDDQESLGTGSSLAVQLSTGTHTIRMVAVDDRGKSAEAIRHVTSEAPRMPDVTIASPHSGFSTWEVDPVTLAGSASDYHGLALGDSALEWSIDPGTPLGTGATAIVTFSPGDLTVRLTAHDALGNSSSAATNVLIRETSPPAILSSTPASAYATFAQDAISVAVVAKDYLGGLLDGSSIVWSVNGIAVAIGSSGTFSLGAGTYVLKMTATDHRGKFTRISRTLTIWPRTVPVVTVAQPANGFSTWVLDTIQFSGNAIDFRGNEVAPGGLVWRSSLTTASFGTGPFVATTELLSGDQFITLEATDAAGLTAVSTIAIRVDETPIPQVVISSPANPFTTWDVDTVLLAGSATDFRGQPLPQGSLTWTSSVTCPSLPFTGDSTTVVLTAGEQTVTLSAVDDRGKAGGAEVQVQVQPVIPPVISVQGPTEGLTTWVVSTVPVDASAVDYHGNVLSPDALSWSSDLDGALASVGTTDVPLTTGSHLLTVVAVDVAGRQSEVTRTVHVVEPPPPAVVVSIPGSSVSTWARAVVPFTAVVSDFSGAELPEASMAWRETLPDNRLLGTGPTISATFSVGTHTVELTATDGRGHATTATVTVIAADKPVPIVTIAAPPPPSWVFTLVPIQLIGSAIDPTDGATIPDDVLIWSSSISGWLATTSTTSLVLSTGTHLLTLTAMDSLGYLGAATSVISVVEPPPPVLILSQPIDGLSTWVLDPVALVSSAAQFDGLQLTGSDLQWFSDVDGWIASGETTSTAALSVGEHVVSLLATDSRGKVTERTAGVTILDTPPPEVWISSPADGFTTWAVDTIPFAGSAVDFRGNALTGGGLTWAVDGVPFATGSVVSEQLATGTRVIQLTATDERGKNVSSSISVTATAPTLPQVTLSHPATGFSTWELDPVELRGSALDFRGLAISDSLLIWSEETSGLIGSGSTRTTVFAAGDITLTLTATDLFGNSASRVVSFSALVTPPPTATVSLPVAGYTTFEIDPIPMAVSGVDYLQNPLPSTAFVWTLDGGGSLLTGDSGSTTLAAGGHVIRLTATDHRGKSDVVTRAVDVMAVTSPVVAIVTPSLAAGEVLTQWVVDPVRLAASGLDFRGHPLEGLSLTWTSDLQGLVATGSSTSTALTTGLHVVTVEARDEVSNIALASVQVELLQPPLPAITIASPPASYMTWAGDDVSLTASAVDFRGNTITPPSASWSSDPGLPLPAALTQVTTFEAGSYLLTFTAIDEAGQETANSVVLDAQETPSPAVTITAPTSPIDIWRPDSVAFTASATDYHGLPLPGSAFRWESQLATLPPTTAPLGTGSELMTRLPTGVQTILLTATDSRGHSALATLAAEVTEPPPPSVAILLPTTTTAYTTWAVDLIQLAGQATDYLGNPIAEESFVWSSTQQGLLATGSTAMVQLMTGTHVVVLTVTDGLGKTASAAFTATGLAPTMPIVTLLSPSVNLKTWQGDPVPLAGSAVDFRGQTVPQDRLYWSTDLEGPLTASASTTWSLTAAGRHAVQLRAVDALGNGSVRIRPVEVRAIPAPELIISSPSAGFTTHALTPVAFSGSGVDLITGRFLTGQELVWTSSLVGTPIGTGTSFLKSDLPEGQQVISLSAAIQRNGISKTALESRTVNIEPSPDPSVIILSPSPNATLVVYQWMQTSGPVHDPIRFEAAGYDFSRQRSFVTKDFSWRDLDGGPAAIGYSTPLLIHNLATGFHTIEAKAVDSIGRTATATVEIEVRTPPLLSVDISANFSAPLAFGTAREFLALVSETSPLGAPTITWSDDSNTGFSAIGNPILYQAAEAGNRQLICSVVSTRGQTAVTSVQLEVLNPAPVVSVSRVPDATSVVRGTSIAFTAAVTYPMGTPQSDGLRISYRWDQDGVLIQDSGTTLTTAPSVGGHDITVTATNGHGMSDSATSTVTIEQTTVTVAITEPKQDGQAYGWGTTIDFRGTGHDPVDGELTASQLEWLDQDFALLGTGPVLSYQLRTPGQATLQLRATNSDGGTASASRSFQVGVPAPTVAVLSHGETLEYTKGQTPVLQAVAFDALDGRLPPDSLTWTSDHDGELGSGATLPVAGILSKQFHRISARTNSSRGATAFVTTHVRMYSAPGADPLICAGVGCFPSPELEPGVYLAVPHSGSIKVHGPGCPYPTTWYSWYAEFFEESEDGKKRLGSIGTPGGTRASVTPGSAIPNIGWFGADVFSVLFHRKGTLSMTNGIGGGPVHDRFSKLLCHWSHDETFRIQANLIPIHAPPAASSLPPSSGDDGHQDAEQQRTDDEPECLLCTAAQCSRPEEATGSPVIARSGELRFTEDDLRYEKPGIPFVFRRTYNNQSNFRGPIGYNWNHNFNWKLRETIQPDGTNKVSITSPSLREIWFIRPYYSSHFVPAIEDLSGFSLSSRDDGGYDFVTTHRRGPPTTYVYERTPDGLRLVSLSKPPDYKLQLTYGDPTLPLLPTRLIDTAGEAYSLTYSLHDDGKQLLRRILVERDNRTIFYQYALGDALLVNTVDSVNQGRTSTGQRYFYEGQRGALARVVDPTGKEKYAATYDPISHRVVTLREGGVDHSFSYDLQQRTLLKTAVDGSTKQISWVADNGAMAASQGPSGQTVQRLYSGDTLVGNIDENGNLTQFARDGNRLTVTLPDGAARTTDFDTGGRVTFTSDELGRESHFRYDTRGRLTLQTDPLGHSTEYEYDDRFDKVTRSIDPNGGVTRFKYDNDGRLVETINALGGRLWSTISTYGSTRFQRTYDPVGRVVLRQFDLTGRLTSVQNSWHNSSEIMRYDAAGRIVEKVHGYKWAHNYWRPSVVTRYAYDTNGKLARITHPDGTSQEWVRDPAARRVTLKGPRGFESVSSETPHNRTRTRRDALGFTSLEQTDAAGNPVLSIDERGQITRRAYDSRNRMVTLTAPDGLTIAVEYDAAGQRTAIVENVGTPVARRTEYTYDLAGRVASVTEPDGTSTGYEYDSMGNRTALVVDAGSNSAPASARTEYHYNVLGQLIQVTSPAGNKVTFAYDKGGLLTARTASALDGSDGRTWHFAYHPDGRRSLQRSPGGLQFEWLYDTAGNVLHEIMQRGHAKGTHNRYWYDLMDRKIVDHVAWHLRSVIRPKRYGYDEAGNLVSLQNRAGASWSFSYDALDRLNEVRDPLGRIESRAYDGVGNLTERRVNGVLRERISYDQSDRPVTIETFSSAGQPATTASNLYDSFGNLLESSNGTATVVRSYDAHDRITALDYRHLGVVIHAAYDRAGNRSELSVEAAEGTTQLLEWDLEGRPTVLELPDGSSASFSYNPHGERTQVVLGAAGVVDYTYDMDGRPTSIVYRKPDGSETERYEQTYDIRGNVTSASDSEGWRGYEYDTLNRLTRATYPDGTFEGFVYDGAGNRTAVTTVGGVAYASFDKADQLLTRDPVGGQGEVYTYGSDGSLSRVESQPAGTVVTYSWNGLEQLQYVASSDGVTRTFDYTASLVGGLRWSDETEVDSTRILWAPDGNPLLELNGAGSPVRLYIVGSGLDDILGQINLTSGEVTWNIRDHLGSVRAVVSSTGAILAQQSFTAFGQLRTPPIPKSLTRLGFTGREFDSGTGLLYLRARHYSTALGRFINQDPIGFAGGLNLYQYVGNNPVTYTDPLGLIGPLRDTESDLFGRPRRTGPRAFSEWGNSWFLFDFLAGSGETDRTYDFYSPETKALRTSAGGNKLRDHFYAEGCKDVRAFSYGTFQAARDTLPPSPWSDVSLQVGGFICSAKTEGDQVTFTVVNYAGAKSFFYHVAPNRTGTSGPFRTIKQTFKWTEFIDRNKCGCKSP